MDDDCVLRAVGLTRRYGDFTAVDGLDLSIRRGEIYGFLGLNGAGKTTTIRMLLGLIRPSAGSITLLGEPLRPGSARFSRVGCLVETLSLIHISQGIVR